MVLHRALVNSSTSQSRQLWKALCSHHQACLLSCFSDLLGICFCFFSIMNPDVESFGFQSETHRFESTVNKTKQPTYKVIIQFKSHWNKNTSHTAITCKDLIRVALYLHTRGNMSKWATALWGMKANHVKEHPFPQSLSQAFDCRRTPICSPLKKLVAMIWITQFLPPGKYYSLTNSLSCSRLFEVMIMHRTNITDGTLCGCCSTVILSLT